MNATMKAIIKKFPQEGGLAMEDVPVPSLEKKGGYHVIIKVRKTAICGTDVHIYNWDAWAQKTIKTPQIIGHEFVGEVVEVGKHVKHIKVGQIVSAEGHVVCDTCRHCITGSPHLCRKTVGIGVNMDGVFSEYVAVPADNVWVCGEGIDEDILSIQDPLGNAVHTALTFPVMGEDVLITGAGPIGLMAIPVVKRGGARSIVVTDVNPDRLKMAKDFGATHVVDVRTEKIADAMQNIGMTEGFDVGLEMSGSPIAFNDMIDSMVNGGNIALLGIVPADTKIDWDKIIFRSLTLKGIYGRQMYDTWFRMTSLLRNGLDKEIAPVITHRYHYTQFQEAFDVMRAGQSGKVILNWE